MSKLMRWVVEGVEVDTPSGYAARGGASCPVCHGKNVIYRRPRNCSNPLLVERRAKCEDCKSEWTGVFRLNRYSELGIPAKTAAKRKQR